MRQVNPIRQARHAKHLQVAELAALVGVTATTIWRWERGLVQPTHAHTRALAAVLDTPAVVLVPKLAELIVPLGATRRGEEDIIDAVYD